jgi:hypothetical protein
MDHRYTAASRARVIACVAVLSACATAATSAAGGSSGFAITQSLVSNGGGFMHDDCYRLLSAIGQPVLGTLANDEFILSSGFLADSASTDDKLFRSGFESSTGICK